jgi:uncharacterized membrane protein YhaH (DUF805 family)
MKVIRIGRAEDNDYIVSHPAVSGHHADLYVYDNGALQYIDHSTNGSMINGAPIHNASCYLNGNEYIGLPGMIYIPVQDFLTKDVKSDTSKPDEELPANTNPGSPAYENVLDNTSMFKRPFSFNGRIRRTEYFLSCLITGIPLGIMEAIIEISYNPVSWLIVYFFVWIPILWFGFAQGAKRCHDLGHSGWFQLIPFFGIWMLFVNGQKGNNQYGNNPKKE